MNHITEGQVIEAAERLNMPAKPSLDQMQQIAAELGTTYGRLAVVWDGGKLGARIKSERVLRDQEKKEEAKGALRNCIDCGAPVYRKRAIRCLQCAARRHNSRGRRK